MRTIATLLSAVCAVAGCGDAKPKDRLPVVYERGGGFAYQPTRLEIDRKGHAVLTQRTGAKVAEREFDLSDAELAELRKALDAAAGVEQTTPETGCADCFEYSVDADGVEVDLDDVSIDDDATPDELSRLVGLLQQLG